MTLERLKWLVLTLVALLLVAFETAQAIVHPGLPLPVEFLFTAGVLVTIAVFNEAIFRYITRLQLKQVQQFRELLALRDAALDITSEVQLDVLLQRVVERAMDVVGADRGGIVLTNEEGRAEGLVTAGKPDVEMEAQRCKDPRLALEMISAHTRSTTDASLAAVEDRGHPPAEGLVAVAVTSNHRRCGALYLVRSAGRFTEEHADTLSRFATQAALAIENARLQRLIREMAIGSGPRPVRCGPKGSRTPLTPSCIPGCRRN